MKVLLLAAAAFIASPLIAQTTPDTGVPNDAQSDQSTLPSATPDAPIGQAGTPADQSAMPADQNAMPADQSTMPKRKGRKGRRARAAGAGAPDPSMTTGGQSAMPADQSQMGAAPMASDPNAADPAGGYQPAGPAMQGQMQPGAPVTFQPSMAPSQAFPAPAPLASYPTCKKGQFDNCRERGSPK